MLHTPLTKYPSRRPERMNAYAGGQLRPTCLTWRTKKTRPLRVWAVSFDDTQSDPRSLELAFIVKEGCAD